MINNEQTITEKHSSIAQRILFKLLDKIQYGKITLFDRGHCVVFSGREATLTHSVSIHVYSPRAYQSVLFGGSLGAGESYTEGDWDTDDLTKLVEIFIKNSALFEQIENPLVRLFNFIKGLTDRFRNNNMRRAKNNILAHYDLGNEFFQLILDPTMMYSCALYQPENINQEQASQTKLAAICQHLQLKSSDHILEIGSGWGGFAFYAANEHGCKITTTTISDKQYAFVKHKIKQLGLENQIELLNVDYRQLTGQYDKLVSIEMIEAVGYRYLDRFFLQCNHLLKTGGLFLLQAIVINDQAYDRAKNETDFIKKHIFPGGCLPSIHSISQSIATQTTLQLIALQDIGNHYVTTINDWYDKLIANRELILKQGFNENFIRLWQFYFCYCAGGFNTKYISDIHALWYKR